MKSLAVGNEITKAGKTSGQYSPLKQLNSTHPNLSTTVILDSFGHGYMEACRNILPHTSSATLPHNIHDFSPMSK